MAGGSESQYWGGAVGLRARGLRVSLRGLKANLGGLKVSPVGPKASLTRPRASKLESTDEQTDVLKFQKSPL